MLVRRVRGDEVAAYQSSQGEAPEKLHEHGIKSAVDGLDHKLVGLVKVRGYVTGAEEVRSHRDQGWDLSQIGRPYKGEFRGVRRGDP